MEGITLYQSVVLRAEYLRVNTYEYMYLYLPQNFCIFSIRISAEYRRSVSFQFTLFLTLYPMEHFNFFFSLYDCFSTSEIVSVQKQNGTLF